MPLEEWGWDKAWEAELPRPMDATAEVARVVGQERDRWSIQTESGPGKARLASTSRAGPHPVVGDWVLLEPGPMPSDPWSILAVLPRRSRFSRGSAGSGGSEQVLAANADTVWIVHGLDTPVNPRRLERYLALAWESGASPEVVLTKADVAGDLEAALVEVRRVALGVPVRVVSASDEASIGELGGSLGRGRTVALLGPSGAGKSTLVNLLAGRDLADTGAVRPHDHKGRHTTTRRELFMVAGGALLLDTPGLRELRVWDLDEGLEHAFPEIGDLARGCRFHDCRHRTEPGCAVLEALHAGRLDASRLASFGKLQAEAEHQARKTDPRARAAAVSEHKTALKTLKAHPKYKDRT